MAFNLAGAGTYTLAASIGSTDTSIVLTSFTEPVTGTAYTMGNLATDIVYATIGPGTSTSEFISFTGITQNGDGTATLTGVVRGLARKSPFTTSASYKQPHSGQTTFILSNPPQVYNKFVSIVNDETVAGIKTFSSSPRVPTPTSSDLTFAASVEYVNDQVAAGAPDASTTVKGVTKLSTAPVSPTDPIAAGTNDTRIPTQGENDALVGTSGTPSTSNKYVTNDDTATAATADKVARRLAGGNVTVVTESFGNNTTNAASTAFVQAALAGTNSKLLFQSSTPLTQSTANTSKNAFFTHSIAGGTLGTGNVIRVRMRGTWQNANSAVPTDTLTMDYGATTVFSIVLTPTTGTSTYNFEWEVNLYATGATNSQTGKGSYLSTLVNTAAPATLSGHSAEATGNATEDSTASKNLIVSGQYSQTAGAPTVIIADYTVEILR